MDVRPPQVWSSPSYNGEHIFVGSDYGFLYCLDIDGKLLTKMKLNGKVRSSSPCLSFYDEESERFSVFIGTYNGGIFCLNQIRWNDQVEERHLKTCYGFSCDNKR